MRLLGLGLLLFALCGCNSIYMKPHTLDTSKIIYAQRGGFSMQRSIKETMDKRGYKTTVGKLTSTSSISNFERVSIPESAHYAVRVEERKEILRPIWCIFNGFWWWNFEVSISERKTGNEILTWRGRGCANSSIKRLNAVLDELEMEKAAQTPKPRKNTSKKDINDGLLILAKQPSTNTK